MRNTHRRWLGLGAALLIAAIAAGAGWYGSLSVQLARADSLLTEANSHIEQANKLLAELGLDNLDAGDFSSLESIDKSGAVATVAAPRLDGARQEIDDAADAIRRAQGLSFLPAWYHDYLSKKEETAGLRSQQTQILAQKTGELTQLYTSGAVIFTALQERDRLIGQFQTAYGMIKDDPAPARDSLVTVAQGLRATESQLDSAYQEQGFNLLRDLAASTADFAGLAELALELADAATAGDQARIQDSSALLETKLQLSGFETGYVDTWWQDQITPLEQSYQDLQARQEQLDAEAAAFYNRERRPSA